MKKVIFILIFLLIAFNIFAQEDDSNKKDYASLWKSLKDDDKMLIAGSFRKALMIPMLLFMDTKNVLVESDNPLKYTEEIENLDYSFQLLSDFIYGKNEEEIISTEELKTRIDLHYLDEENKNHILEYAVYYIFLDKNLLSNY